METHMETWAGDIAPDLGYLVMQAGLREAYRAALALSRQDIAPLPSAQRRLRDHADNHTEE